MAVCLLQKFYCYVGDRNRGVHDWDTHSFAIMLSNTAPDPAAWAVDGDVPEIAVGNGYAAGGHTLTGVTLTHLGGGVWQVTADDFTFAASGGTMDDWQYAVLYNLTAGSAGTRPLVGFWDRGVTVTLADGQYAGVEFPLFTDV